MKPPRPTAEAIRAYREANECSVFEANDAVHAEWRAAHLRYLRTQSSELYTVEQCQDVIRDLLDFMVEVETHRGPRR